MQRLHLFGPVTDRPFAASIQFFFTNNFDNINQTASAQTQFISTLITLISTLTGADASSLSITLARASSNGIAATLTLPQISLISTVASAVSNGQLQLTYPVAKGSLYSAVFTDVYGPCPEGSVSSTGSEPGCDTCRANTYVSPTFHAGGRCVL